MAGCSANGDHTDGMHHPTRVLERNERVQIANDVHGRHPAPRWAGDHSLLLLGGEHHAAV